MQSDLTPYVQTRKAIEKSRSVRVFIFHLFAYIVANAFLGGWNLLTYYVKDSSTLWFYLPLLFWGVGLILHYLHSVALFDEWWELDERTIRNQMIG